MSIPPFSVKCVIKGHLANAELFETSFWDGGGDAPVSDSDANTYAADVMSVLVTNLVSPVKAVLGTTDGLDELRCYFYPDGGPNAKYVGVAPFTGSAPTGTRGLPNQIACAVTLTTGLAGRRNRGRMYFPIATAITGGGLFTTTPIGNIVTGLANSFTALNALGGLHGSISVVSSAGSARNPVTAVHADSRPDVQRRRANKIALNVISTAVVS